MKSKKLNYILLALLLVAITTAVMIFNSNRDISDSYDIEKGRSDRLLDSLKQDHLSRKDEQASYNSTIDSLSSLYAISKRSLAQSKREYNILYAEYKDKTSSIVDKSKDSISVADCDAVIDAADKHITVLSYALVVCDSISETKSMLITSLSLDTLSYSRSLRELQSISNLQDGIIRDYKKKQNSWWNKNKLWIGLVGGALITSGTAYSLSK